MAPTRTPRTAWVEEGLSVLGEAGVDAVRVEVLAHRLGVTKGGFYGYFRDRAQLLAEMVDTWEHQVTDRVVERVEADGGTARDRLRRLAELVWGDEALGLDIDLAMREWARRDPDVAARVARVDGRKLAYLRGVYAEICDDPDEVEVRAVLSFSLWIAGHLGVLDHSDRPRADLRRLLARRLLA